MDSGGRISGAGAWAQRTLSRLSGREVGTRELVILLVLMAAGLLLRIAYVLVTKDNAMVGDAPEYHLSATLASEGKWFYTSLPYGDVHEGIWKTPGYPAFLGVVYTILGASPTRAVLLQSFMGPVVILLVWLLARRLFDDVRVAVGSAALAAFYPNMWGWEVELFPEVFALPLALLVMLLVLERPPSIKLAAGMGFLMGISILVRPSQFFLFGLILVAWVLAAGVRRGVLLTALTVVIAVLCIAPWSIRNYDLTDEFIPLSMQDNIALAGVFNDTARNDPRFPWAWRPFYERDKDLYDKKNPLSDGELHSELGERARDYIDENPSSVVKAWFWNGGSRLWDIRRPGNSTFETDFDGRSKAVGVVGLGVYWVLLLGTLVALVRFRRRTTLVLPLLAAAFAASLVFTVGAVSRYRLPLEPAFVILGTTSLLWLWDRVRARGRPQTPAPT